MKKYNLNTKRNILLLITLVIFLFIYTVIIRKPWKGVLADGGHQWVTGHSLLIARQWNLEGPGKFKFGLPWNPSSIEFPDIPSRGIYSSFPSGMIWPIYIISIIRNHPANISMLMNYNLLNHFLITLVLTFVSYLILLKNNFPKFKSLLISGFTSIVVLFSPGPLYWFQNTYFTQEAIILPYCLIILIETFKTFRILNYKFLNVLESLVVFYALYTDWLAVFIVIILFANNIFLKRRNIFKIFINNLHLIIPSVTFIILFMYQTLSLTGFEYLKYNLFFRTAISDTGKFYVTNFFDQFWKGHALPAFGIVSLILLLSLLLFFTYGIVNLFIKNNDFLNKRKTLFLINLVLIPNLLEIYFLKNHSAIHNFTSLKLIIPISLAIPLILFFLKTWFKKDFSDFSLEGLSFTTKKYTFPLKIPLLSLFLLILSLCFITNPHKLDYFPKPNYLFNDISEFIKKNTNENDIVFSPNFQIPTVPPQRLSLSLKRIYFIENIDQIKEKIKNIESKNLTINLFIIGKTFPDKDIQTLISHAYETVTTNINSDQKHTIISDLTNINPKTPPQKAIISITQWNDNNIYLYKIKL